MEVIKTYEEAKASIKGHKRGDKFRCVCGGCQKEFEASYNLLRAAPLTGRVICGYCKGSDTFLQKYGVKGNAARKDVQKKMTDATLEKYGVTRPFKNKAVQESVRKTFKEKYGVEFLFCDQRFQDKKSETVMNRYGVSNIGQLPAIKLKIRQSCSSRQSARYNIPVDASFDFSLLFKEERIVYDALIRGKYQRVTYQDRGTLGGFEIDWLLDGHTGIECNGAYWHSLEKKRDTSYHQMKFFMALKKGVRLFQFFDFEVHGSLAILPTYLSSSPPAFFSIVSDVPANLYQEVSLSFWQPKMVSSSIIEDSSGGVYVLAIDNEGLAHGAPKNGYGSYPAFLSWLLDQGYRVVQDRRLGHIGTAHIIGTEPPHIKHNCADAGYAILSKEKDDNGTESFISKEN